MRIEDLIVELSKDPFNPELNFKCAVEYKRLNQTASAVSFYLRTAEYGAGPLAYNSLLKMAECFNDQNNRVHTVTNCYLQAIALVPTRPEAYFLLSQFHERAGNWQECYTWAEVGLQVSHRYWYEDLPDPVGYLGTYCLEFEKAVSAWWIGRKEESIELLQKLYNQDITKEYKEAVRNNLERIGVNV